MLTEKYFSSLATDVRAEWSRASFDENVFAQIVERQLNRRKPSQNLGSKDIIDWALFRRVSRTAGATSPSAIEVYADDHFCITVYFCLEGSIAIHHHAFSGALHLIEGSSIHSVYQFKETQRLNDRFKWGQTAVDRVELLKQGDTRQITRGAGLIHQLFHLDRPTVCLVVRTLGETAAAGHAYRYWYPSIAFAPHPSRARSQFFAHLANVDASLYDARLVRYLRTCDPVEAVDLLGSAALRNEPGWAPNTLAQLKDAPYAEALEPLTLALREHKRVHQTLELRRQVTSPNLRRVLAILLTSRELERALSLLRETFPQREPRASLLWAMEELAALELLVPQSTAALEILGHLLDGCTSSQVCERLARQKVPTTQETIVQTCTALREHHLLQPILASVRTVHD